MLFIGAIIGLVAGAVQAAAGAAISTGLSAVGLGGRLAYGTYLNTVRALVLLGRGAGAAGAAGGGLCGFAGGAGSGSMGSGGSTSPSRSVPETLEKIAEAAGGMYQLTKVLNPDGTLDCPPVSGGKHHRPNRPLRPARPSRPGNNTPKWKIRPPANQWGAPVPPNLLFSGNGVGYTIDADGNIVKQLPDVVISGSKSKTDSGYGTPTQKDEKWWKGKGTLFAFFAGLMEGFFDKESEVPPPQLMTFGVKPEMFPEEYYTAKEYLELMQLLGELSQNKQLLAEVMKEVEGDIKEIVDTVYGTLGEEERWHLIGLVLAFLMLSLIGEGEKRAALRSVRTLAAAIRKSARKFKLLPSNVKKAKISSVRNRINTKRLGSDAAALIEKLRRRGVKITDKNIVRIGKDNRGNIVWLEEGKGGVKGSGMKHIVERHLPEFLDAGITENQIPDFLMEAVINGRKIGKQNTRTIFEVNWNGKSQRVAVDIGTNGYIVGANMKNK